MLSERDIKKAVLHKLLPQALAQDAVVVSEMVVGKADRRADLVVANGHLHAIEIKSDLDSLRRLEGQMAVYLSRFDKVTLVLSSKFVEHALAHSPDRVAVWEATETRGGVTRLRVRRPGRLEPITDKAALCDFLLKSELVQIVKSRDAIGKTSNLSRCELVKFAETLPLAFIRREVLSSVKTRYRDTFAGYVGGVGGDQQQPPNVDDLSRVALKRKAAMLVQDAQRKPPHYERRPLNLLRFFPDGDIPEGMPTHVLVPTVN
ncbi:sce7726 family protein [Pandoraea fibrosis]|uniref:Sce7726 family protein n=1 Tax=Pandoraea fibrosis TaxID=1891094 RepID=A0ABX6HNQ9_9BURK|nr:sce7726 family protein [Pandoraea fibrosis]QHE94262.1 sce7726 family protein [Pandoraea fibrosis]QHF12174.1 sce7726 family protein [Pandoraea fibrosis]